METQFAYVAVDQIRPNPLNPRTHFDKSGIAELAESLKSSGMLQPLIVYKKKTKFILVCDERRFRAANVRVGYGVRVQTFRAPKRHCQPRRAQNRACGERWTVRDDARLPVDFAEKLPRHPPPVRLLNVGVNGMTCHTPTHTQRFSDSMLCARAEGRGFSPLIPTSMVVMKPVVPDSERNETSVVVTLDESSCALRERLPRVPRSPFPQPMSSQRAAAEQLPSSCRAAVLRLSGKVSETAPEACKTRPLISPAGWLIPAVM